MSGQSRREARRGLAYSAPMGLWFTIFFVLPLTIILIYSFLKRGLYGGVTGEFSLVAYQQMFNPSFGRIVLRTIWISIVSTFGCFVFALPAGYAMARSKHQTLLLFLIIIPFWTNSLIRIYAWISILSREGFLNQMLMKLGIINEGLQMIYTQGSVILVLIYMFVPFAVLPLFTTIDKFDFSLLDAARDLGATKLQALVKVLFPQIRGGMVTALIFTFIPIFGSYTVPLLVGGKDSTMIGNIIVDQVNKTRNWPLAAAFSVVLTFLSMIGVLWMLSSNRHSEKLNAASKLQDTTQQGVEKRVHLHHQDDGGKA
ncbi:ABC transporter permease [Parasphaerochaeta coccoides]|uniref:Binding-protein-dependent transport systems inner membrane component n=1 Tax=Parasphaerochaeta coccoides (strain ATCC BAA-1237 / DSM 17374 / SPN1) TaxID=760011 RepID=F4GHV9_PARC1|nr:ABC transporter permease [Parasphaerochaeta coccoides]AEC02072.1 binding-protein-dependent transport systems inner membrane component [Parasphaerochaeta coccoides DSM 17374]